MSQHHPFLAIASADGTCVLADVLSALRKKSRRVSLLAIEGEYAESDSRHTPLGLSFTENFPAGFQSTERRVPNDGQLRSGGKEIHRLRLLDVLTALDFFRSG